MGPGIIACLCLSTSTLLGPPSTSGGMAGARLFESDDMISCITQLPRIYALLPEDAILNVWFGRDMSDRVCLVIRGTDMGPVYCRWNVGLFASDALRIRMDNPVVLRVVSAMGNKGLHDPLIDCWNTLDIGSDEGMEVMTFAGDAPGYLPPWFPGLPSCLCIVMNKDSRVYAIVWCLLCAVHLVCFWYTGYDGCHSTWGAVNWGRSGWPLIVLQCAGLMAPPMRTWWTSLEITLVTGSLLFVAPGRHLAELSDCELVMRVFLLICHCVL